MRTFILNGNEYIAKPFDFNMVCDLEDMGISLEEAHEKPTAMVRAYVAVCIGRNKEFAGAEMEQHIINGGSFAEIMGIMSDEMDKSDFFRHIKKAKRQEIAENQGEETETK